MALFYGFPYADYNLWTHDMSRPGAMAGNYYVNKIWDSGGPGWITWTTRGQPDTTGTSYPDPHGTGFGSCSGYRVAGRYAK